jgi:hypothetical protein
MSTITTESFRYWADSRDSQAAVALLLWLGKDIPTGQHLAAVVQAIAYAAGTRSTEGPLPL